MKKRPAHQPSTPGHKSPKRKSRARDSEYHLNPYPAYKPSGVKWLGDVPAHWDVRRLKTLAANIVDQTTQRHEHEIALALENVESWSGRYVDAGPGMTFESQLKRFQTGDVLFGKLRPYLAKVACPGKPGVCVGEFLVLRPRDGNMSPGYLQQVICSKPVIEVVNASTFGAKMPRAEWQFIGNMEQPVPTLSEQTTIVEYLDKATDDIEAAIARARRQVELLQEYRTRLIADVVTGRIDVRTGQPYPAYKHSGIEWLGAVPAHWDVRRLASCIDQIQSGAREQSEVGFNNGVPNLGGEHIGADNQLLLRDMRYVSCQFFENLRKGVVQQDDILLVKDGATIGKVAFVREMPYEKCSINEHVYIIRPTHNILSPLLFYNIRSSGIQDGLWQEVTGSAQPGLNSSFTKSLSVALPPLSEQTAIVEYLDKATAEIAAAITRARRQVELLQEYRTRLVADVVTGKLAVREAPAQFPGETGVLKHSMRWTY